MRMTLGPSPMTFRPSGATAKIIVGGRSASRVQARSIITPRPEAGDALYDWTGANYEPSWAACPVRSNAVTFAMVVSAIASRASVVKKP